MTILWPDPDSGPWVVTVWWRVQHGAATPVGIRLTSWKDGDWDRGSRELFAAVPDPEDDVELPTVGSQMLKSLPVGRLIAETRAGLLDMLDQDQLPAGWTEDDREHFEAEQSDFREEFGSALAGGPRGGRDLGDDHYREVARVYASAARAGRPPTGAVADHFTVTKSAAAKQVARARERGFLPKTSRGRVGKLSEEL